MIKSKWVPDRAKWFTVEKDVYKGNILTITFLRDGDPYDQQRQLHHVQNLHDVLQNADNQYLREEVLQQMRDKPLSERIKQPRYQDDTGEDWIDQSYRELSWEEFCGAMKFTIGKYMRRLGKKDDEVQELEKVADYGERWVQKAKLRIREKV